MRAFFKGWRQKVGCVVLVMACATGAAWVRSLFYLDSCAAYGYGITSDMGQIGISRTIAHTGTFPTGFDWASVSHADSWKGIEMPSKTLWSFGFCGIVFRSVQTFSIAGGLPEPPPDADVSFFTGIAKDIQPGELECTTCGMTFPYWIIVLGACLSALLILWKPRKKLESTPPQS